MSGPPLDVVRAWFTAFNRGDREALVALYAADVEFDHDDGVLHGREAVAAMLARHLDERAPALEEGGRRRIRTLASVESGTSAEWVSRERLVPTNTLELTAGHDLFVIRDGLIVRQREVRRPLEGQLPDDEQDRARQSTRRYPDRPVVGVGAVVVQDGRVLLIKRRFEPLAGQWSLPGGTLEIGETLAEGVARELVEETGLAVEVGPVVDVFDRILFDADGRVRYHFVLIDYLCRPVGGRLQAGSDVADAVFAHPAELPAYRITPKALGVIERGLAMSASAFAEPLTPQPLEE